MDFRSMGGAVENLPREQGQECNLGMMDVMGVNKVSDQLDLEVGAGYTWQNAVGPAPDREFSVGRAAARYRRALGEKAEFVQVVEFLPNFKEGDDRRVNSETSLSAPITTGIAMKASYVIRYDGLPQPGFETTDRILTTGIQVTF